MFSRHNFRSQNNMNLATAEDESLHRHTHTHTRTIRSYVFINIKPCSSFPGYLAMTGAKIHGMCLLYLQQRTEQCCGLFTIRIFYYLTFWSRNFTFKF